MALYLIPTIAMNSNRQRVEPVDRRVFVYDATEMRSLAASIPRRDSRFVLFVAADTTCCSVEELIFEARKCWEAGATYVCCWGPDCERFHDCFDEAASVTNDTLDDENVLMTTWHATDTFDEALDFALTTAVPTETYQAITQDCLIVTVGNPSWNREAISFVALRARRAQCGITSVAADKGGEVRCVTAPHFVRLRSQLILFEPLQQNAALDR